MATQAIRELRVRAVPAVMRAMRAVQVTRGIMALQATEALQATREIRGAPAIPALRVMAERAHPPGARVAKAAAAEARALRQVFNPLPGRAAAAVWLRIAVTPAIPGLPCLRAPLVLAGTAVRVEDLVGMVRRVPCKGRHHSCLM